MSTANPVDGSISTALCNTLATSDATASSSRAPGAHSLQSASVHGYTTAFGSSIIIFIGGIELVTFLLPSGAPNARYSDEPLVGH